MNAALRKKLAREARNLAEECINGTAPTMNPREYCGCAIGEIVKRTIGVRPRSLWRLAKRNAAKRMVAWELARDIDCLLPDDERVRLGKEGLVSAAVRRAVVSSDYTICAVPLLALADALEAA